MFLVKFIDKNNNVFTMPYHEVRDFCKNLCFTSENKQEFDKFKINYTFFEPFFDFIIFKLEYVFCIQEYTLSYYPQNKVSGYRLYDAITKKKNYQVIRKSIKEMIDLNLPDFPIICLSGCSDKDLHIQKINKITSNSFLIDEHLFGYISKIGDNQGNHTVTANTIINQKLICNSHLINHLKEFAYHSDYDTNSLALIYIMAHLGYILYAEKVAVYNEFVLNKQQQDFIESLQNDGFITENMNLNRALKRNRQFF